MPYKRREPNNKIKPWTPTRRQLIEELGTDTDVALGKKYSLSANRVRELRYDHGIATYAQNKNPKTPLALLEEKVQSLEDELMRLYRECSKSTEKIREMKQALQQREWRLSQAVKNLEYIESRLNAKILNTVIKEVGRERRHTFPTKRQRFSEARINAKVCREEYPEPTVVVEEDND